MKPTVCIGYCFGNIDPYFHKSMLATLRFDHFNDDLIVDVIDVYSGPRIVAARNEIVRLFVEHEQKPDWLLMVDTDMVFSPDAIYQLLAVADEKERPIVGGLAFVAGRGGNIYPTMYRIENRVSEGGTGTDVGIIETWPDNSLVRVDATGAACILMHRSVLEKMREVVGEPQPWYAETVDKASGSEYGEDFTFCVRATRLGYPIYVHTGVEFGHRKSHIYRADDHTRYLAERGDRTPAEMNEAANKRAWKMPVAEAPTEIPLADKASLVSGPTYVVIPYKDRPEYVEALVDELLESSLNPMIYVFDNGSTKRAVLPVSERIAHYSKPKMGLHQMWNMGMHLAEIDAAGLHHNVAILNDDLKLEGDPLAHLVHGLRSDPRLAITYPDSFGRELDDNLVIPTTGTNGSEGMTGWAMCFKGELGLRFDTRFEWWYGDNDMELSTRRAGYLVGRVNKAKVVHLQPNVQTEQSPELQAKAARDREAFEEKWATAR